MDSDTERIDAETEREPGDVEAYWRRRVYVLAGGITLIGLVAWACSDSGHKRSTAQVRNAAATITPAAAAPAVTPTPTATVTITATPTVTPSAERRAGDRCDDQDMVIGIMPVRPVFKGKEHPRFGLSVVSTGPKPCTFDVGPKALPIKIMSGPDHVWSSAQCMGGTGSNLQMLKRGVPYYATLDWDRKRCESGDHVQPGTYVIAVGAPGVKTRREVFRLR
jgi:hypothetical protein